MLKNVLIVGMGMLLVACGNAGGTPPADVLQSKLASPEERQKIEAPVDIKTSTALKWIVDKAKSRLEFIGVQSGDEFTGKFTVYDAQINFAPNDLNGSMVIVTIDMNSADARDAERNDALPGKEWFYTKKFPEAKYEASSFIRVKDGQYIAKGNLTMRSISMPLDLPFSLNISKSRAIMDGEVQIDRTKFGVGTGVWASPDWANHDVTVRVHLEAKRLNVE